MRTEAPTPPRVVCGARRVGADAGVPANGGAPAGYWPCRDIAEAPRRGRAATPSRPRLMRHPPHLLGPLASCGAAAALQPRARAAGGGARRRRRAGLATAALALAAGACGGGDDPTEPTTRATSQTLPVLGLGAIPDRFTAEVAVRGSTAYTTTWGRRGTLAGNALYVWDVSGATPVLADSAFVEEATTLGDVQISDDGALLLVGTEPQPTGKVVLYSLANPRRPERIGQFGSPNTANGVHTAKLARVGGTLYGFLAVDPGPNGPARLVVLDLSTPAAPREVFMRLMGGPVVHDVFVRDGLLFTALWHEGLTIWDIGGGGRGGTPGAPVQVGNVRTVNGSVHNVAWVKLPDGDARYAWVGEEGPGGVAGAASSGDIHVVDVSDPSRPREVAVYGVPGAGTHNFAVDEGRGILYAAYYNAGVRALDVRGDLGACTTEQRTADGRCDLVKMGRELAHGLTDTGRDVFVWGVALEGGALYASDMFNGLWKLGTVAK